MNRIFPLGYYTLRGTALQEPQYLEALSTECKSPFGPQSTPCAFLGEGTPSLIPSPSHAWISLLTLKIPSWILHTPAAAMGSLSNSLPTRSLRWQRICTVFTFQLSLSQCTRSSWSISQGLWSQALLQTWTPNFSEPSWERKGAPWRACLPQPALHPSAFSPHTNFTLLPSQPQSYSQPFQCLRGLLSSSHP